MPEGIEYRPEQSFRGDPDINETGDPNVLVREMNLSKAKLAFETDDARLILNQISRNFSELIKLGLHLPDPRIFIEEGKENTHERYKVLAEIIEGHPLDLIHDDSIKNELEVLYLALIEYLSRKIESRQPFLYDIFGAHQYRYGHTKKDQEDKIYLVDLDPEFLQWQSGAAYFGYMLTQIEELEEQSNIKLDNIRQKIVEARAKYKNPHG